MEGRNTSSLQTGTFCYIYLFLIYQSMEKEKIEAEERDGGYPECVSPFPCQAGQMARTNTQSNRYSDRFSKALAIRDSLGRQTVARSLAEYFDMNREMCWCLIPWFLQIEVKNEAGAVPFCGGENK